MTPSPVIAARDEAMALRWGRGSALAVLVVTAVNWVGWATGREILVRTLPGWPLMPPWTSLWLFALASAVLLMSGRSGLAWAGRLVSAAVAVTAAIIVAEYVAVQGFGIDRVWFRQSVDNLYRNLPGRPSEPAAVAALLLSVAIGVSSTARSWARWCWGVCLTLAMAIAGLTGIAYLFGAIALASETPSTGLALGAAVGTLLTGAAAALTRPARVPVAWLLSTNQRTAPRLLMLLLGALLLVGALRRVFMAFGASGDVALSFAVSLGIVLCGAAVIQLSRNEQKLLDAMRYERNVLRASSDAMLDPQALVDAVRGHDGQVVDLVYRSVNRAACQYFNRSERELVGTRISQAVPEAVSRGLIGVVAQCLEDGQPVVLDNVMLPSAYFPEARYYDVRANQAGADLISITARDVTEIRQARARIAASEQEFRLLAKNIGDVIARVRDDTFVWMSPSAEDVLGAPPAYWVGRKLTEFVPPQDADAHGVRLDTIAAGGVAKGRIRVVLFDGTTHWAHLNAKPYFDATGRQDGFVATLRLIDDEVAAHQAAEAALREAARADARYRRSMEHSAIGMALLTRDGHFDDVNEALCQLVGYPRHALLQKTFQDLTAPEHRDRSASAFEDLAAGRQDSFRMTKQCIHADGHRIWGDVTVSSVLDENDAVDRFLAQIIDITALTEANTRNRALAYHLQELTEKLSAELGSAAAYMSSIMPHSLTGNVSVASCYLPSRELGGDCFDYRWIDDDHLLVYLIDVSGHGLQPALLAVSIHNLLRSGTLSTHTLLSPKQTLTELNNLFRMDSQSNLYFTAWYGIFEHSTRTLRYASAGAPPALALAPGSGRPEKPTELSTPCPPVGILPETPFVEHTYVVPEGCQLLIYSDGAFELNSDAPPMPIADFTNLVSRLAASPRWSLDQLVHQLQERTPTGTFEDDCSLIQLTFN
ncbi:MAG: PAS domain S-box protein [Mycobacterium sp.]|nr:PAS domain S-box protein [Mycobacterium sp.]